MRRLEDYIDGAIVMVELGKIDKQLVELEAERGHRRMNSEEHVKAACLRQRRQRLEQRLERIEAKRKDRQS